MKRLLWLDVTKGLAILIVVYFHFFRTYFEHGALPPPDWSTWTAGLTTLLGTTWLNLSGLGFHAVGVFIILSGWALMQSTARRADAGPVAWGAWYWARFIRLYPMYWVAHVVYLVSPFTARFEKIDGRLVLSLLGLRFVDISNNFYYLNAAWWYFGMLIQFYLIFPLLFWAARKLGPARFLLGAAALGFFVRYLLLVAYPQNGMWVQGGLALCRLPEFAFGMALGTWASRAPERIEKFLLGGFGLLTGVVLYPAALQFYHGLVPYIFVDFATGVCCFLVLVGCAGIITRFPAPAKLLGLVGAFSYGVYLIHHPYVIWLGLRIREQPIWMFLVITAATLAVLCAWGIFLEKMINALVTKLVAKKARARA
ncbi:MAG: acyltransferase [Spartobacteria bacterium]